VILKNRHVGLVGDRIDIPLFPRVSREQTFHGSFWGNYTDLSEVMALAAEDKIRHSIKLFKLVKSTRNLICSERAILLAEP
jgi:D-arabinose 1-dehydrogenase-like Zn-dependent alcohol dehydrogenase